MNSSLLPVQFAAFFILFSLISCGGGSGGSSGTPASTPASVAVTSSVVSSSALSSSSLAISSVLSSVAALSSAASSSAISNQSSVSSAVFSAASLSSMSSLASSSSSSSLSSAALAAPQNLVVIPANGSVTLSWNSVAGATGYSIYYASESGILINNIASFDDGTRLQSATSPYVINSLRNNENYYFVVTAVNGDIESAASSEVSATPVAIDLARQPTAQEVLMVELINRARANPEGEAARYSMGLNDGITGTAITATAKPPLAHNLLLIDSARTHSQWMLDVDFFSHTGNNNSTHTERMIAAGYSFAGSWTSGENIAWGGSTGSSINLTDYAVAQHQGLFESPGHRVNILNADFREIGVGQKQGYFAYEGRNYLSSMITQNFARSGANHYLTGVVYSDTNNNSFYDVGEGLSGVTISFNGKSYPVFATGAYSIPVTNGSYSLTITGDVLGTTVYHSALVSGANLKVDIVKTGSAVVVIAH